MKHIYLFILALLAGLYANAQITVDGDASDWANATAIATETNNVTSLKASNDADNLYFLAEGNIDVNNSFFFDTDNNPATGFVNMQGYDFLFENEILYVYAGDGTNWVWNPVSGADVEWFKNSSLVEVRIAKASLAGLTNEIRIFFYTVSSSWTVTGQIPASAVPVSWLAPNYETNVLTFGFSNPEVTGNINNVDKTIILDVPFGTDVSNLIADFTISTNASITVGATAQISGTTSNDFSSPVIYTVTAENMTSNMDWTVTVNILPAATDASLSILTVSEGVLDPAFASNTYEYTVELPIGTTIIPDVTAQPTDDNASFNIVSATNLTGTQAERTTTVTVTAEDITITQDYTIEFNVLVQPKAPITFVVDNNTNNNSSYTGFALKGSWDSDGNFDASWNGGAEHTNFYDDGTHGDVTADDNIWTVIVELVPDGGVNNWEWGVNDQSGNWIDGNFQFSVIDTTPFELNFEIPVGIKELLSRGISIHQNSSNNFIINTEDNYRLDIININGKILNTRIVFGVSDITIKNSGIYFLKFSNNKGSIVQKIIVK